MMNKENFLYRPDIDGLRTLAVIAVLAFHGCPSVFRGGFIGVDIFFVISGFLLSSIIFTEINNHNFSFIDFYSRRIVRIFPALFVVLLTSYLFGWFFLFPDEFSRLGKQITASSLFFENLQLAHESSYFDESGVVKPLLHLWSLGIEGQFYVVWPVILWIAYKFKFNLLGVALFLGIFSFCWNLYELYQLKNTTSFYLLQVRFWELLLGAVLAYLNTNSQYQKSKFLQLLNFNNGIYPDLRSLTGLVLIIIGLIVINDENPYPGVWAIFPTFGALLLISAGPRAFFNKVFLSSPIVVWFGKISYPLYLWHWVLLVFVNITFVDIAFRGRIRLIVLLLSIFLAWLTFRIVEDPIHYVVYKKLKALGLISGLVLLAILGYFTNKMNGFEFRAINSGNYLGTDFEKQVVKNKIDYYNKYSEPCDFKKLEESPSIYKNYPKKQIDKSCTHVINERSHSVFLWGDSHAQMLTSGLINGLPSNWNLLRVASQGCKPNAAQDIDSNNNYCERSNYYALKRIKEIKPDVVVLAQRDKWSNEGISQLYNNIKNFGVNKIIFIGQSPEWNAFLPNIIMRTSVGKIPRHSLKGLNLKTIEDNKKIKLDFELNNTSSSKQFINLIDLFCNDDGCMIYLDQDIKSGITTFDNNHLSPIASDYLAKILLVNAVISK